MKKILSQRDKDRILIAKQTKMFLKQGGEIKIDHDALSLDEQILRIRNRTALSANQKRRQIAELRKKSNKSTGIPNEK